MLDRFEKDAPIRTEVQVLLIIQAGLAAVSVATTWLAGGNALLVGETGELLEKIVGPVGQVSQLIGGIAKAPRLRPSISSRSTARSARWIA